MTILIEHLRFDAVIGILPHERVASQTVQVDCIIDYNYSEKEFINYADVVAHIKQTMRHEQFFLIEEALESLAASLNNSFPLIRTLSLTLRKPDILPNCTVGVQKNFIF